MARLRFNALLEAEGLDADRVAIVLHTPQPAKLRALLPVIVHDRPELFAAYQSVHSEPATKTLLRRDFMASFIRHPSGRQTFAGLFRITDARDLPTAEIYGDEWFNELEDVYGASDTAPSRNIARISHQVRFETEPVDLLSGFIGRLQIAQPPGRAYVRVAANLDPEIVALSVDDLLMPPPPRWDAMVVHAPFLRALPESWAARLREWRAVYLIVDERDGARYVGSAYGEENLLSRWRGHVARDKGITARLIARDPRTFRFSILELLNPSLDASDVIETENRWKERLHTRQFGLNEN
ncbi:hypothetical protein GCM10011358_31840 [Sinisalibacter lacisalsi]|uniref:GIY-YIG domain-containing protein n=1 Tax=Sinisalibacter lacisalsi TaxID=1526570 RepID=A0ABQ1QTR0_9RHOB|nr:hypothetical protein GCM10011358_31840 [Sinisalibacter lacisalsi]